MSIRTTQITDSAGLGVNYIATAKITATANLRYLRARSTPQDASGPLPDIVDISKIAAIGANYAITRSWGAGCNASYEKRDVSGGQTFAYDVKIGGLLDPVHLALAGCRDALIPAIVSTTKSC